MDNLDNKEQGEQGMFIEGVGWWQFDDDDHGVEDAEELEMLREAERGEWRSVPNLEEEMERARATARATMATWSMEQLAEVERRAAARAANGRGGEKSLSGLAGDGVTGDNPPQSETRERPPGGAAE